MGKLDYKNKKYGTQTCIYQVFFIRPISYIPFYSKAIAIGMPQVWILKNILKLKDNVNRINWLENWKHATYYSH